MKNEELYKAWKENKGQIDISKDFSEKVMHRVNIYEENRRKPLFDINRLIEIISASTIAKAAMIAGGAIVGFVRVAIMIHTVLFA